MPGQPANQYAMQDPTKQYPQPKFAPQPQSAPGLAQDMDPKPDHGEDSYRGFGRLVGRRAIITGADSGNGRAAAIAFAREGADVASPRRGRSPCSGTTGLTVTCSNKFFRPAPARQG